MLRALIPNNCQCCGSERLAIDGKNTIYACGRVVNEYGDQIKPCDTAVERMMHTIRRHRHESNSMRMGAAI